MLKMVTMNGTCLWLMCHSLLVENLVLITAARFTQYNAYINKSPLIKSNIIQYPIYIL